MWRRILRGFRKKTSTVLRESKCMSAMTRHYAGEMHQNHICCRRFCKQGMCLCTNSAEPHSLLAKTRAIKLILNLGSGVMPGHGIWASGKLKRSHLGYLAPCVLTALFHAGYINVDNPVKNMTSLPRLELKLKKRYNHDESRLVSLSTNIHVWVFPGIEISRNLILTSRHRIAWLDYLITALLYHGHHPLSKHIHVINHGCWHGAPRADS